MCQWHGSPWWFLIIHQYHPLLLVNDSELMNVSLYCSANTSMSMHRSPLENIAHQFVFTSLAVSNIYCLYYLDCLPDGRPVDIQLLFCGVLLPGFFSKFSSFPYSFSSRHFVRIWEVQSYNSTDLATAWKSSCFILLEISNFYVVDNLSIVVHALPLCIFTLLSLDEILLPRYINWSKLSRFLW